MKTRVARAVGVLVAGTVVLSACHGGGSGPNPSGSRTGVGPNGLATSTATSQPGGAEVATAAAQDKCRIVSATAVKAVIGGTLVAETSGLSGVGNPVCMFEFTKTASRRDMRILFSANQSGTRVRFRSTKTRTVGAKSIPALGDDAFFVRASSTLQFIKGPKIVIIQANVRRVSATGAVAAVAPNTLITLARAVLAQ